MRPEQKLKARTRKQELKQRHGRMSPTSLFPCLPSYPSHTAQACFLGMALPTMAWDLLHQSAIRKIPHRHGYKPIQRRRFLNCNFLFPGVKLTVEAKYDNNPTCLTKMCLSNLRFGPISTKGYRPVPYILFSCAF